LTFIGLFLFLIAQKVEHFYLISLREWAKFFPVCAKDSAEGGISSYTLEHDSFQSSLMIKFYHQNYNSNNKASRA
jgi:hypothetical protein